MQKIITKTKKSCSKKILGKKIQPKIVFHKFLRKLPNNIEVKKNKKNKLISAKQPNLILTRNGFDIIVN